MKEILLTELRRNFGSGRALVAFLLMLSAFLISIGMMSQEFQRRLDNHVMSKSLPDNDLFFDRLFHWRKGGDNSNSDDAVLPLAKVKEPEPLMFFARGLDVQMRHGVDFMSTFPIIDVNVHPEEEKNLLNLVFPAPDFLFVQNVLVSLLAMVFGYNMVSGERERGTLKLMLVSGAGKVGIFTGKVIGGLVTMWVAFSSAFFVYVLTLSFLTPVNLAGEDALRVLLIYLACLLHIAVFFCLATVMSVVSRSSSVSLVLSLFFWIVLVFVLPGLSSLVAQQFAPVESENTVAQRKLKKAQEMERAETERKQRLGIDTNRNSSGSYGRRHDNIRQMVVAELDKIQDEHDRRKDLQIALTAGLAKVSPAGPLSNMLTSLGRTGIEDADLFNRNLDEIRLELERAFQQAMKNPALMLSIMTATYDYPEGIKKLYFDLVNIHHVKQFRQHSLAETFEAIWMDYVLLACVALAALALAFSRFLLYDVR